MLSSELQNDFLNVFQNAFEPPFSGSIDAWASKYVDVAGDVAIPGPFSVSQSPYMIEPLKALQDPRLRQVNLVAATQTGKNLTVDLSIAYWIVNDCGPMLKLNQSDRDAEYFAENRLYPILNGCPLIKPILNLKRYTTKKKALSLPNASVTISGIHKNVLQGRSIRYLFLDEVHAYDDPSMIDKAIARTTAFAGRRKIVITSQPDVVGSQLHKHYNLGSIYEWNWQCPSCKKHQPWRWTWQREDKTYAGINWETILNQDSETTNIALSSKTAWLECYHCKHKVHDGVDTRRLLNDTGRYECIKNDGDAGVISFTWPGFVNIHLTFETLVAQYLNAKKVEERTGLNADVITFEQQVLGKFYKQGIGADHSKIMRGEYTPNPNDKTPDWLNVMGVDCQQKGDIKFYVVRAFHRNGNESRKLICGACTTFEEIDRIAKQWGVDTSCVGIDSGWNTDTVYQECIKHGEPLLLPNGKRIWKCWQPFKGDKKLSYDTHEDGIARYYSPVSKQDPKFPYDSIYRGLSAPLVLWSNYCLKSILMNLRDNKINGVKWLVNDNNVEYEKQMYSENLCYIIDKKTGLTKPRYIESDDNHYLDCEAQCLVLAIMAGVFSPTKVNEDELVKAISQGIDILT